MRRMSSCCYVDTVFHGLGAVLFVLLFTGAMSVFGCDGVKSASGPAPVDLRCGYRVRPVDVEAENPMLGWRMESGRRGWMQSAYHIMAATDRDLLKQGKADLWNSGRVDSGNSVHVPYDGAALSSRDRVWWKVRVWDEHGTVSPWSEASCWDMGLLDAEDWKGKWIGFDSDSAPMLRREFELDGDIDTARAYICGLGYYDLYINGTRVGDQVLDPGQTDYEERAFYIVHDVTDMLRSGNNAVGVVLGDGWYNQTAVNEAKYGWGDVVYGEPRLLFQLEAVDSGGEKTVVVSDESWRASESPILSNNVYAGEVYDARLEQDGWSAPDFDDSSWHDAVIKDAPGGELVSQKIPPVRRMETLKPMAVTNPEPGVYVYDMGRNFAGWARLELEADAGTTIQLTYAETLFDNGMIDVGSTGVGALHVTQTDRYTCRGGDVEIWEPRFTYQGFRYVEMTGFPGTPAPENLTGISVYTDVERTGTFECSDDMLNRIYRTAIHTQTANLHSVPEDCPAREKCGWLGDAHVVAEMTMHNFDMTRFWEKYVMDIETNRRSRGGIVEDIAPGRRQEPGEHPDWGSAFIQIPWYIYLYYGDISVIEEHYRGMSEFLAHVEGLTKDHIVYDGYGDWCQPGGARPIDTPVELTSTAYFYFDAVIMSKAAALLGLADDAERYAELADAVADAFVDTFYDAERHTFGSQTADCFSLYLGLVPEGDEQKVADSLARDVTDEHDGHLNTGVTGSLHLYQMLGDYGYGDVAYGILGKPDYPGFGYWFSMGATTFWEKWEEVPGSLNHPMQGGFAVWFHQGVCGILPDENSPGFRHIIFRKPVCGDLTYAKASCRFPYGVIASGWEKTGDGFVWEITVPDNSTATVHIPSDDPARTFEGDTPVGDSADLTFIGMEHGAAVIACGSGTYRFTVR